LKTSESITKFCAAFTMAQTEMKNPPLDSTNPHFRSKFASLAGVRDSVVPVLNKHGIAVTQLLGARDGGITCETILIHSSGEWMSGEAWMPSVKSDAQGYGSAATYARRYSLMAICGVVGDEDDDGNAASKSPAKGMPAAPITPTTGALDNVTAVQRERLESVLSAILDCCEAGMPEEAYKAFAEVGDNDEKVALWELLKPHSKVRSAVKAAGEALRKRDAVQPEKS